MNNGIDIPGCQRTIYQIRKCRDSHIQQIRQRSSDHIKCQPEYSRHNCNKAWNSCIFSRQDLIHLRTSQMFLAFFRLHNRSITDLLNKCKTHICNCCGPIKSTFLFHLLYNMLQELFFILIQLELFQDQFIPFCQFACRKSYRNVCLLRMILDQMHDPVQASVYCSAMVICITEILSSRTFLIFCHMHCMFDQFFNSFILRSRYWNNRYSKFLLHLIYQDRTAVVPHLIHHIQCQNHRNIQLHQLHGQIQVPLNIGCIHDIDDSLWMLI